MRMLKVLGNPSDEVVFKDTFDYLVKKIGGQHFVNISVWKVICERLPQMTVSTALTSRSSHTVRYPTIPY